MAQLVLLVSAVLLVLLPTAGPRFREAWRSPYYLWVVSGFGLTGILRVTELSQDSAGGANELLSIARFVPMLVAGAVIGARSLSRGKVYGGHLLLLLLLCIPMAFAAGELSLTPFIAAFAFLPALAVDRQPVDVRLVLLGLVHSLKAMAVMIALYGAVGSIVGACRLDKCSLWGQQLGELGSGNALGVAIAILSFPIILTARKTAWALIAVVASGLLVDLCSSRSALIMWSLALVAALLIRTTTRMRIQVRTRLMAALTITTALLVGAVAVTTWQPDAFTYRGVLWLKAQELIQQNPLLGVGSTYWVRQPITTALTANYSAHNLALEVLVSTGLLGALALVGAIILCARRTDPEARIIALGMAVVWLAAGMTEVTSAPGRLYLVPALLPLVFVLFNARSGSLVELPTDERGRADVRSSSPGPRSPAVATAAPAHTG
ncbi:O-antigen ligase family protein [Clavibacter zhangzhiyongii]|uniref:O-antigen ligase family protein n=1 Tax=Clavibacter zhangzhiyongii TaxID=2768071 RepID=A0A7L7YYN4_9MICO|nr:O-antigen ligase family protein [Clavibacter zhangzhiyongii]QOD42554.1 O-antigen ligase family protein [Clavibacter zhangzhiyongii]